MIRLQAKGSVRFAAPTCTAVAPASSISITFSALLMPPMPMMGTETASYTCHTIRRATGNTAGPEKPPMMLASTGRRVRGSMRMPSSVLIRLRPSAPASSQARATAAMSVTLGVSLMNTGLRATALTAFVTSAAPAGSVPKLMPPPWTLGQEMLISRRPMRPSASKRAAHSTYSSTEKPEMLAMAGLWNTCASFGSSSSITARTPGFCRPTLLSMPHGHSAMRGSGLP